MSERPHLRLVRPEEGGETSALLGREGQAPSCYPHAFRLHNETREVSCYKCGKAFLPFDALEYVSRDWDRYADNRTALKREVEALTVQRETLRREVQLVKAQLRRAQKRSDT